MLLFYNGIVGSTADVKLHIYVIELHIVPYFP